MIFASNLAKPLVQWKACKYSFLCTDAFSIALLSFWETVMQVILVKSYNVSLPTVPLQLIRDSAADRRKECSGKMVFTDFEADPDGNHTLCELTSALSSSYLKCLRNHPECSGSSLLIHRCSLPSVCMSRCCYMWDLNHINRSHATSLILVTSTLARKVFICSVRHS